MAHEPPSPDDPVKAVPTAPGPGAPLPAAEATVVSATPAGVPERIGRYHIKRAVASGGMGTVYEAIQEQPRRTVALKLMRPGLLAPAARRRFEYEAQILARLRHPAIAQVYEAGTHRFAGPGGREEEVPYFAMEFVPDARTLTEYAAAKKLTIGQRLELFAEVCDAVHHGHQKGIVHRDLKPGNILIDSSGRPKVIDFGVARAVDADLAGTIMQTAAGQIVGTLQYMSPEQVEADPSELDARSDVYSLGVVLYELVTGKVPYDLSATPVSQVPRLIREQPPVRPSGLNPSLRGDPETIILTALRKDRDRRYASAAALGQDIRSLLASSPIAARRDSSLYVLRTRARASAMRHPVGASLFAAVAGFLVGVWPGPSMVFRWTPLGAWFERTAMGMAAPATAPTLDKVRVVAITDDTDAEALAAGAGVEGVVNGSMATWRPLHARLMERLAGAGVKARVLVWDSWFRAEGPDDAFAAGVRALRSVGVEVLVVADWTLGPNEAPVIRPAIRAAGVRWGGISFVGDAAVPWKLDLVAQRREHVPMPSLALEAFAASLHPGAGADYILHPIAESVEIRFHPPTGDPPDPCRIPIGQFGSVSKDHLAPGLQAGDTTGFLLLRMPDDDTLRAATVPYAELFGLDDTALHARLDDKAIIVGNFRRGAHNPDEQPHPGGRLIRLPYAHAVGLDTLLSGPVIRLPRFWHIAIVAAVASALGVAAAWGTRGRATLLVLALLALTALSTGASLFVFLQGSYLCNPAVPVLCMVVAAIVAAWIVGVRRARLARRA